MKIPSLFTAAFILYCPAAINAQQIEKIKYGDFDTWVSRSIKESAVLGGAVKTVYAVGPDMSYGDKPYVPQGGSPWASSNVLARVSGITKTSNAIYPDIHPGYGKCAKLCTEFEHVTALGLINLDVVVAGTLFLGKMYEPIKSTKNPYTKMEVGVPFNKRPTALMFDYKLKMPDTNTRIYSSGFGAKKTLPGIDRPVVFILLQHRWEDSDGNLYAKRVGTGHELFDTSTDWVNGHTMPIKYGNAANLYDLMKPERSYHALNSRGKLVPVNEVGWDNPDATPTHMVLLISSGEGEPYTGTIGVEFSVDNVALVY